MSRAFTLIEVLVAVTIMMILMGVGTVAYRNVARKQSLDQFAAQVSQALTQAQANALSGKKQYCGTRTLVGWRVIFASTSYQLEETCQTISYAVKTVRYPNKITGTLPSPNPILFRVLSRGTNVPASTTVTLTNGQGLTKSVTVSNTGEIK